LSGSLVAVALARSGTSGFEIDLIDVSGTFGPGLAYAPRDPQHVLNVPAGRVSVRPDDADHFVEFARTIDPRVGGGDYVERSWFGEYVRMELADAEQQLHGSRLSRVSALVEAVLPSGDGAHERVVFEDGSEREYDEVVLALGNLPGGARIAIPLDPRAFPSPWTEGALDVSEVAATEPFEVLIVGTAHTAIDAILSLTAGHESVRVTAVSRSGELPFAQLPGELRVPFDPPSWAGEPLDLDTLVQRVHDHVRAGVRQGFDWRDAIDGIRRVVPKLWRSLTIEDQARFIAEYDRDWGLRRHRVAPKAAARLEQLRYDERVVVQGGGAREIIVEHGELVATLQPDGGLPARTRFDRVIDCTGAATDIVRTTNPLVTQLLRDGRVLADPHRRGLRTDDDGTVLAADERPNPRIHTLGLMRRGELWETVGIAEIRDQAYALAARLAAGVSPG
jgi:uncharacterized NAD(P)/FAD-binding protein YdhS